jgi:hypothetical protein
LSPEFNPSFDPLRTFSSPVNVPSHAAPQSDGWYIEFYFVDPDTVFISVHQ